MDASELALKMLEWEKLYNQLMVVEERITEAVLELERTQTVGNVRASYSGGRRTYDYEGPALAFQARAIKDSDEEAIVAIDGAIYGNTKTVINWNGVCKDLSLKGEVVSKSEPSVRVKLL